MASPATPTPTPDPYDLGDTSHLQEQPRGSDGRFVPTETPTPPTPLAPRPSHPQFLVNRARYLGIPDGDIQGASTSDLTAWVDMIARDYQQQATQPIQPIQTAQPQPVDEWGVLEAALAPYEEPVKAAFKHLAKSTKEAETRAKAAEQQLTEFQAREQAREEAQAARQVSRSQNLLDAFFVRLAKDPFYKRCFGEGTLATVNQQSPEFQRRIKAIQAAGIDPRDVDGADMVKLKAAADLWRVEEPAPAPTNGYAQTPTPEQWQAASLARPSERNGAPEPNGRQKAIDNLRAKLRARGDDTPETGDQEILDSLYG